MMPLILEYYLKFNLLLAGVYVLWWAIQQLLSMCSMEQRPQVRLRQARILLSAVLAVPVFMAIIDWMQAASLQKALSQMVPEMIVGAQSVSAGISDSLLQNLNVWGVSLSVSLLIGIVLVAGIGIRAAGVLRNWRKLGQLVRESTVLHHYSQLDVLLSEKINTPFSTRALGRNQVVLPYDLVHSPSVFNIAVRHEIQHLRNGDLDWVMLLEALKVTCFWNPFAHLWQNTFDCLQEFACDEALVQQGTLSSTQYGNCLLEVASREGEPRLFASSYMVPRFSLWGNNRNPLKRRILMLSRTYGNRIEKMKSLITGLIMAIIVIGCSNTVFTEKAEQDRAYLPEVVVPPSYPVRGMQESLTGWVQTQFTVNSAGNVEDAIVVDKCVISPEGNCLDDTLFDETSLAAVRQFKFKPHMENNTAVATKGVQYVFSYCLAEKADEQGKCSYPERSGEGLLR